MIKKIFPFVFLIAFGACSNGYLPGMGPGSEPDVVVAAITSFSADKTTIEKGQSVILSWETAGAAEVILDPVGAVDAISSVTLTPLVTTTYTLSIYSADAPSTADGEPVDTKVITITVTEPSVPPPDDNNPPPVDDPCVAAPSESALKSKLQISSSSSSVYAGESITVTWSNSIDFNETQTSVSLADNVLSTEPNGSAEFVADASRKVMITASVCGESVSRSVDITVKSATLADLPPVYSLSGNKKTLWAGTVNGQLFKSANAGGVWEYVSTLNGVLEADVSKEGEAPVAAVVTMGDDCDNAIFMATQNGHFYRSYDEGKTASGLIEGPDYMLAITKSGSHDLKDYSQINFLIKNPKVSKEVLIGHNEGLWRLKDCKATGGVVENFSKVALFDKKPVTAATKKWGKVFVIFEKTLYESADTLNWEKSSFTGNADLSWLEAADSGLYVGSSSGVYYSEDGVSFNNVADGKIALTGYGKDGSNTLWPDSSGLKIEKSDANIFYLAGLEGGVKRTWYKGATFWILTSDNKLYSMGNTSGMVMTLHPIIPPMNLILQIRSDYAGSM